MEKEKVEYLEIKGKELSDWLKENFNPYTVIVITDTGVKIFSTEYSIPNIT